MFAENHQLSIPQIKRIFFIEVFSTFSLTMPAIVTRQSEYYGMYALLLGVLFAAIYLLYLLWIASKIKGNYGDDINDRFGRVGQTVISSCYVIRFIIKSAYTTLLFLTLVQNYIVTEQKKWQLLLPFFCICAFVAYEGIETRGRILELLAFFMIVSLLFIVFLSLPEVSIQEWMPKGKSSLSNIVKTSGFVFLTYAPMEFVLFYGTSVSMSQEKKKRGNQIGKAVFQGYGFTVAVHMLLFFTTIGLFGVQLTKDSMYPAFAIMETAKLPADFISRLDIFFIAFWIFAMFGVISGYSTYSMWLIKDRIKGKKKGIILVVFFLLSGSLSLYLGEVEQATHWFFLYLAWIDVPLAILIPVLVVLKKKRRSI